MRAEIREVVAREALTWVGTPFHHGAKVKGVGVDCGQLLVGVFKAVGLLEPDFEPPEYPPDWHLHTAREIFIEQLERRACRVGFREPLPGDIALFRYGRGASHGAIVIEWPEVVHATGREVVRERAHEGELAGRLVGIWSL